MHRFVTIPLFALCAAQVSLAQSAVDVRLWIAPADSVPVVWAGPGGPFSPTSIGTSEATGGVGVHVFATLIAGTDGLRLPPAVEN